MNEENEKFVEKDYLDILDILVKVGKKMGKSIVLMG